MFEAMFHNDFKEKSSKGVEINDLTPSTVSVLLKYLYCREVREIQESSQLCVDLLRAADKYNIKDLQQTCQDILESTDPEKFTLDTALDCYLIGNQLSLANIETLAVRILKL